MGKMIEKRLGAISSLYEHILAVAKLPAFGDHPDPFDRLPVAQSQTEPLVFLTADAKLARYGSTMRVV